MTQQAAFVISLDFELHWGRRDHLSPTGVWEQQLLATRAAIPRIVEELSRYEVGATWATVGCLFAETRDEVLQFRPERRAQYLDVRLRPDCEPLGKNEAADPLHFGWSLVRQVLEDPRQELASHSYDHYYALAEGQGREDFEADLMAVTRIARYRGVEVKSYVFPRNQVNESYLSVLRQYGFTSYRGTTLRDGSGVGSKLGQRRSHLGSAVRFADWHLPLMGYAPVEWPYRRTDLDIINIPATRFLIPCSAYSNALDRLRFNRIARDLEHTAGTGGVYHLWWHPHNFGSYTERNLELLRRVLQRFAELRDERGLTSMTMGDVARSRRHTGDTSGERLDKPHSV